MGITIFTPTYNRAYTLKKLYISLCNQTNKNFEWLIIDDGSTDNTKELIQNFISDKKILIRYFYQENSGKSMAHNKGVELANQELFTCVDSDDYITNDAVEIILDRWKKIRGKQIGIMAKRMTPSKKNITVTQIKDGDTFVLRKAYQNKSLFGDTFLIFSTNIIKNFSFPKFIGEKFVPEDYLYDQIGNIGEMSFLDKSLYICEYLKDGYTQNMNKLIANNPKGYRCFIEQRINFKDSSVKNKIFNLIRYESISFVIRNRYICKGHILGSILTLIPGYILYRKRFKGIIK